MIIRPRSLSANGVSCCHSPFRRSAQSTPGARETRRASRPHRKGKLPMTDRTMGAADGGEHTVDKNDRLVILASSVGTVIEWYDFYLYGSLAAIISAQFFSGVNETTGFIFALMAFAAGFAVRPFGAIVFG